MTVGDALRSQQMTNRELLALPLIGPAHAPAVLDGVTEKQLLDTFANAFDDTRPSGAIYWQEISEAVKQGIKGGILAILSRIAIAIPNGYGTVDDAALRLWTTGGATITVEVKDGYTPHAGQRVVFLGKKEE